MASDLESEPEHLEQSASEEIDENAQDLQPKYNEELVVQKTVAPSAAAARGAFHGHRLFLSKEIRMLHKKLSDGSTREVHHIAQTADLLYNNPEQYAKPAPRSTSTEARPNRFKSLRSDAEANSHLLQQHEDFESFRRDLRNGHEMDLFAEI